MEFVYGVLTGVVTGGAVVWVYKQRAMAALEKDYAAIKSGIARKLS